MKMEPTTMKEHGEEVIKIAKDPVCCMDIDEKTAPARFEHRGTTYYFCSPGCKKAFNEKLHQVYRRRYTVGGWHEM